LIFLPVAAALAVFGLKYSTTIRAVLLTAATGHAVLTALVWIYPPVPVLDGWLLLDAPGLLFLSITSALFVLVRQRRPKPDIRLVQQLNPTPI
jgi:hypothetical protein